jgi:hypothetical protein
MQDLVGPLDAAIYDTVANYIDPISKRSGAAGLAPVVGMLPGTLSNKANPMQEHQLTLRESIPVQLAAHDFQILYAYNALLGHTAYKLPDVDDVSDVELLTTYCALHETVGQLAANIAGLLQDGRITRGELPALKAAFDNMVRAGLGVVSRIEALAQ